VDSKWDWKRDEEPKGCAIQYDSHYSHAAI
jgi:hypothetical protein